MDNTEIERGYQFVRIQFIDDKEVEQFIFSTIFFAHKLFSELYLQAVFILRRQFDVIVNFCTKIICWKFSTF